MSDRPTFEERLNDPLSHFPYKHEAARRGAVRTVDREVADLEFNDDEAAAQLRAELLQLAEAEVDATAAYVAAQEAYLREPTPKNREAERAAAVELTTARRARREARPELIAAATAADAPGTTEGQEG